MIAAAGAKIRDGHTRYGIVPAGGATVRLRERISPSRAAHLFYTAALVDAATLAEWGLVNEVVPKERLLPRAMELATEISQRSPEAIRHIKALTSGRTHAVARDDRLGAQLAAFETHVDGADLARGLTAFRQKQPIHFYEAMGIRFDGRVAIVTGSARGLGLSYARALAQRGGRVAMADLGADTEMRRKRSAGKVDLPAPSGST